MANLPAGTERTQSFTKEITKKSSCYLFFLRLSGSSHWVRPLSSFAFLLLLFSQSKVVFITHLSGNTLNCFISLRLMI